MVRKDARTVSRKIQFRGPERGRSSHEKVQRRGQKGRTHDRFHGKIKRFRRFHVKIGQDGSKQYRNH